MVKLYQFNFVFQNSVLLICTHTCLSLKVHALKTKKNVFESTLILNETLRSDFHRYFSFDIQTLTKNELD